MMIELGEAQERVTQTKVHSENLLMNIEIIDQPIRFHLHGLSSSVDNNCYGEVGCRLMDEMWKVVKEVKLETTGINHWVYFAGNRMFVGIEPRDGEQATVPEHFEPCECELTRYAKHVHVGPYHDLPQKWQALKAELSTRGRPSQRPRWKSTDTPAKATMTPSQNHHSNGAQA